MAYIGKTPTIGNFQVCDSISVVNGQAAYTMQVGSVNVSPESANHMLVSLNGILQQPNSSFTVSASTITFASNLVTGDVIDFIQILGNVLDLGVPSDATVSLAKLTATGTKDSTTFLRGDNTFAEAGSLVKLTETTVSSAVANVEYDSTIISSTYSSYKIIGYAKPSTDNQILCVRFALNGSIQSGASDYGMEAASLGASSYNNQNTASRIEITHSGVGNATGEQIEFTMDILYPTDANANTTATGICSFENNGGYSTGAVYAGQRKNLEVNNGVQLFFASGNIASGLFKVYGVKA